MCEVTQSCPILCNPMDYIAYQAPLSMGFSRQEYWSGLPFPSPCASLEDIIFLDLQHGPVTMSKDHNI